MADRRKDMKDPAAVALGKKCLDKHGREFYRKINALRKTKAGPQRKSLDDLSPSGISQRARREREKLSQS